VPTKEGLEMKRSGRKYNKEFKQEAGHLALKSPHIADIAEGK
jgi:hypothetical protein